MNSISSELARHFAVGSATSMVEASHFRGALSTSVWILQGRRNRIFVLSNGAGRITINGADIAFTGPAVIWVPADASGSLHLEAGAEGAALAIPELVLGAAVPAGAIFTDVRSAISRPILGTKIDFIDARKLINLIEVIDQELKNNVRGAPEVIRHHIALVLIAIWRVASPAVQIPKPSPRVVVRSFLHLLEINACKHWTVFDYAAALGVTPDRLNTATRRATGRTPMELAHSRLMVDAQSMLENSTLQISQVAEALGFRDAAYFSRFFKRLSGKTPRRHRLEVEVNQLPRETAYAAWP